MKVLNFAHKLNTEQLARVGELLRLALGREVDLDVVDIKVQIDFNRSVAEQAAELVDAAGFDFETGGPFVVNLPSLSLAGAAVLAEIHGRAGHFPAVIAHRPIPGAVPPAYEPVEVVNLQAIRDRARTRR